MHARNLVYTLLALLVAVLGQPAQAQSVSQIMENGERAVAEQRYSDAVGHFYMMMRLYEQGVRDTAMCKAFLHGGNCCVVDNRYIEAFEFFTLGMKISQHFNDNVSFYKCVNNVGSCYAIFEDYERAVHYFERAHQGAVNSNDPIALSNSLYNLVGGYCKLNKPEKAQHYFEEHKKLNMPDSLYKRFALYDEEAFIVEVQGNPQQAIKNLNAALDLAKSRTLSPRPTITSLYTKIGDCYDEMGDTDNALKYYQQAVTQSHIEGSVYAETQTYKALAQVYNKMGNKNLAQQYKLKYVELNDSLFNAQRFNAAKDALSKYEEEVNASHISSLNEKIRTQLWVIVAISLIALAILGFSLMIYHYNRKLREAYRLLIEKHKQAIQHDDETLKLRTEQLAAKNDSSEKSSISEEKKTQLLLDIAAALNDEKVIADPDFTINKLAILVHSNSTYINQALNEAYHKNFKSYLIEQRIRIASERLADEEHYGHLTIQAIAASVGYNSPSTFIQAFKRIMGMTPSLYKAMSRQMPEDPPEPPEPQEE